LGPLAVVALIFLEKAQAVLAVLRALRALVVAGGRVAPQVPRVISAATEVGVATMAVVVAGLVEVTVLAAMASVALFA
jgi:hypothetical protein